MGFIHTGGSGCVRARTSGTLRPIVRFARRIMFLSSTMALFACGGISPKANNIPLPPEKAFRMDLPQQAATTTSAETLKAISPQEGFEYRIGPGDILSTTVWRRPELSEERMIVSPDGAIVLPRIGRIDVMNLSQQEAEHAVRKRLEYLYISPEVTINITEFHNNRAFVLGRVTRPGVVNFTGKGSLLEAIALAGGIPLDEKETMLSKCAIIRGNDTVIWIDLQDLLKKGNMSLNASIRNNDVIFIPETSEEMVYVLGEVARPGVVPLRSGLNVVKAISLAGGMNRQGNPEQVFVIRQVNGQGSVFRIDMKRLLEQGDFTRNVTLQPNDIVFISPSGMSKFGYALEKILPTLQILSIGALLSN